MRSHHLSTPIALTRYSGGDTDRKRFNYFWLLLHNAHTCKVNVFFFSLLHLKLLFDLTTTMCSRPKISDNLQRYQGRRRVPRSQHSSQS